MKTIAFILWGLDLLFSKPDIEPKVIDVKAMTVIETKTELKGIYYQYEIKNIGNTIIPARSYKVYFKVNGKTISFDEATPELKPSQTLKYESQKTFYKNDYDYLNYVLEIKMKDSNPENNIIKGQSKL